MAENERDQLVKKLQEIVPNPDPDSSANDNNELRKFWIHEFVRHVDTDKLGKKWLKVDKNKLKKVRIGAANRALTKERMLDIFDEFRNPGSCECFCLSFLLGPSFDTEDQLTIGDQNHDRDRAQNKDMKIIMIN